MSVRFTFYNGNMGTFTFAKITLTFDQTGRYINYDPEPGSAAVAQRLPGGNKVDVGSINMEPYLESRDFLRLGLEMVCVCVCVCVCARARVRVRVYRACMWRDIYAY